MIVLESAEGEGKQDDTKKISHAEPDLALISDLLETTERDSQAQEAHILLMQHYASCGWHEEAKEEAHRVLKKDSTAKEARLIPRRFQ